MSQARGAILGAISSSHVDFQLALELREALDLPYDRPSGRYAKRSSFMQEYTKGLQPLPVPDKLSVKEAASLFELWMKARSLHACEFSLCPDIHFQLFLSVFLCVSAER
jgi:small subunit ribosomal protein S29